jgi:hypothetical protein
LRSFACATPMPATNWPNQRQSVTQRPIRMNGTVALSEKGLTLSGHTVFPGFSGALQKL